MHIKNLISNSQREVLSKKDSEDEQILNEMGFKTPRNKGNVSVNFCM